MTRFVLYLTIIGFISCGQVSHRNKVNVPLQVSKTEKDKKIDNGLTFINSYVENINTMKQSVGILDWVNSNKLATEVFKKELKRIMDEAYRNDPELGMEADPIFDAQDYPDKGFVIESFDEKSNFLTVKGIDWPDFKLTMKIKYEKGDWLVDGCGMVNIPDKQRAKR